LEWRKSNAGGKGESVWLSEKPVIPVSREAISQLLGKGTCRRLIATTLLVALAKVVVGYFVFLRLGGQTGFHTVFQGTVCRGQSVPDFTCNLDPLYLFMSYDSQWYMEIAKLGYFTLYLFAYFPAYPTIIRIFYLISSNLLLSASLPALVFGIAWVPVFQALAERYMDREAALGCTLIAAFFPVIFVFTTLAYTEGIFLFLSLTFWLLYLKNKIVLANASLAIASITRPFGVILAIPMIADLIRKRQFRSLAWSAIPALAISSWLYFGFYSTADWLAFRSSETSFWSQADWLRNWVIPFLEGGGTNSAHSSYAYSFFMIVLVGFVVILTFQVDSRLGLMSVAMYMAVLFFAGPPSTSYFRYFSFIFPIWLLARIRSWKIVAFYCVLMAIHSAIMWYDLLSLQGFG
jgi:hypothetical protein